MARTLTIASAQMGPIARSETRKDAVQRLLAMMHQAKARGSDLVVFPELALTTFFPRWFMTDQEEIDSFFERAMPGEDTAILFETAARLEIGFYLGYAELDRSEGRTRRFNTSILVDKTGAIVGKYRKIHLPGHAEHEPQRKYQHLEKRYFEPGNLGFPVWRTMGGVFGMCICNDRRWPETYRVMGLQGVEVVLLGYNTPVGHTGFPDVDGLSHFHNHLSMQAGAYQNSTWVVAIAKAGVEDGFPMIGGSLVVNPEGEIMVEAKTEADEIILHACDLDATQFGKTTIFDFARHRRIEHYGRICAQTGVILPTP